MNISQFFMQDCLICKQVSSKLICHYCEDELTLFTPQQYGHDNNLMNWPAVKKGLERVSFKHVVSLANYQWPLSNLLRALKFSKKLSHAKALADLFYQHCLLDLPCRPQLIIPIPLHNSRYYQRKFNQSTELAKYLSKRSAIPLGTELLIRRKTTEAQTKLSAAARKKNMRDAFTLDQQSLNTWQDYKHIVLFDDVITTGATIDSAYRLLSRALPDTRIDVWCICLTLQR